MYKKDYPDWLNIKEPYRKNNKWICPYCKREFNSKEEAYPVLIMSFSKYQSLSNSNKYGDIKEFIEKCWRSKKGHACVEFNNFFWKEYEKNKEIKRQELFEILKKERDYNEVPIKERNYDNEIELNSYNKSWKNNSKSKIKKVRFIELLNNLEIIKISLIIFIFFLIMSKFNLFKLFYITELSSNIYIQILLSSIFASIILFMLLSIRYYKIENLLVINLYLILFYIISIFLFKNTIIGLNFDFLIFISYVLFIISIWIVYFLISYFKIKNFLLLISILVLLHNLFQLNDPKLILDSINAIFSIFFYERDLSDNYPHTVIKKNEDGLFYETYHFLYGNKEHNLNLKINKSLYLGAVFGVKNYKYSCVNSYCTYDPRWEEKYWKSFVLDKNHKELFKEIVRKFKDYTNDSDKFVEIVTSFVQQIPYDYKKYDNLDVLNSEKVARFPVEVLVDKKGICSEKSFLLAGILYYAGYDVALLEFDDEEHMAVGIKCNCNHNFNGYCFIETTSPIPIGSIPKTYFGNITIKNKPKIIKLREDGKIYKKCYIDENIFNYKSEIIKCIKDYLIKKYNLTYDFKLTKSIGDQYLPYGYLVGCTHYYHIEKGSPKMICSSVIYQIEKKENDSISLNNFFDYKVDFGNLCLDTSDSKYFGINLTKCNNEEYCIGLLLAK